MWRKRIANSLMRVLGILVGLLFVGFAIFYFNRQHGGWWDQLVIPFSVAFTGLAFIAYGVRGNRE